MTAADLTTGPLRPAILRLALPAVGTTLFQVLFNIVDTFWVGRTLGASALAAVALASYSVWVMVSLGELVSVGLTAVAARRHGEREPHSAARAVGTAMVLAIALGAAVALGSPTVTGAVLDFMGAQGEVRLLASHFLQVQLAGSVLVYGYLVVAAAFRSSGDTRTPFLLLGGSVLLNLILDPMMILGLGPFPALGVYGAALATVLTRGLGFVVGIVLLIRRGGIVLGFEGRVARTIIRIGMPTMVTGVLFSLIYMFIARIVTGFGTAAVAALGVGHKIEGISYMVCVGFGLAAEALVGQNLGAGRPDRARAAGWVTARVAALPLAVLGALFLLIPESLVGIFSRDPEVVAAAALYLRIFAVAQLAMPFENVLEGALSGAGYTFWTMTVIVGLSAVRIPLASFAAPLFGLAGVWWVLAFTAIARAAGMTGLWTWGRWEHAAA